MKKTYYVEYYDKFRNIKHTTIKAKNIYEAEAEFYKKSFYTLVRKISEI